MGNLVKREQVYTYLDTTPLTTETWALLGKGINAYGIEYNPQVTTEKDIISANATSTLDSNQKQATASQKIYKNDACFTFINSLRDKTGDDVITNILDIDSWDTVSTGVYKAKKSAGIIAVTKYMDEKAIIEYTLYYNGDPVEGTVTFVGETPVFTETGTSL